MKNFRKSIIAVATGTLLTAMPVAAVSTVATIATVSTPAYADAGFRKWVRNFKSVARKNGVSSKTYDLAFAGITEPDPEVIALANFQPEFKQKLWMYFDTRITDEIIAKGQTEKHRWVNWLDRIEKKYGVSRNILMAIWSMETGYGEALKRDSSLRNIIRSLSTLAYKDRRRRKFARRQLIAAMKILQKGDVTKAQLRGSWAGAMGHTQFIPTSFIAYRQDMDGDGRRDIWNSIPDALATAANLLKRSGWRKGETWGYEVEVSASAARYVNKSRTLASWSKLGVSRVAGRKLPGDGRKAVLKFPAGRKGPAFLMMKNFYVIKRYNNSDKYALAVGHLADQIAGYGNFAKSVPRPFRRMSLDERIEIQTRLTKMGLYEASISGMIGPKTRKAIKKAQKKMGLSPTGLESPGFLTQLRRQS